MVFGNFLALALVLLCAASSCLAVASNAPAEPGPVFTGLSDASAAVALDATHFVVGDDETNQLRIYDVSRLAPVKIVDLEPFFGIRDRGEADIEASAKAGSRIYWITSHGRNKEGKVALARRRFFATDIVSGPDGLSVKPIGSVCTTLVEAILASTALEKLKLKSAIVEDPAAPRDLAPKADGLNIEGLSASADGKMLYIGLRNPHFTPPDSTTPHAIILTLLNAKDVIDKGAAPVLGPPLLWNLGGHGIRGMEYSSYHKCTFIASGPHDTHRESTLYKWSGDERAQPEKVRSLRKVLDDWSPETVICFDGSPRILLLSDDGTQHVHVNDPYECLKPNLVENGICPNKLLRDLSRRTFRSAWVTLELK